MDAEMDAENAARGAVNRELASWLMAKRLDIERVMQERLGAAAPAASGPEAETLRRFRIFVSNALVRGEMPRPVLDGLKPNERRVMALLGCWSESASSLAGPDADAVAEALAPLLDAFRLAIRTTGTQRRSSGRPRATRRAISAAIDRIADPFLAIDVDSREILDANPAAGAVLGVTRDALIGVDLNAFVPDEGRAPWETSLDALSEGQDSQRFGAVLRDREGRSLRLEASATLYPTRQRTIALVVARPNARVEPVVRSSPHAAGFTPAPAPGTE